MKLSEGVVQLLTSTTKLQSMISSPSPSQSKRAMTVMHCVKKSNQFFAARLSWKGAWVLCGIINLSAASAFN